ncbi:lactate utilization protein [Tissierella pigra]|uniref:lactate utilization protein n=1 Tax=Tissierella pigra TaxID=2607614 RepID=UPI001C0FC6E4|nr:lactate utilization protein [Tissierella pigra]MBU5427286.1 lactate utilization protein [Tissierella pigra]
MFLELEKVLKNNGFIVKTFENTTKAKEELLLDIKKEDSVGIGGSMTIQDMGIYEELKERGNEVYWHWRKDTQNPIEKAMTSDIYITSTNAITLDGKLVNMDGNGNRVASMFFGHKDVYIVIGKNKICTDYDAAIERIRNIAAPLNAKRLNLNTPCTHTGKCSDCESPDRICKVETIIHKKPNTTTIHIYLVNEELGY